MAYLIPGGIFFGFIGFILTLIGLGVRAWIKARRPGSANRWVSLPLIIDGPGELLEIVGLIFILMAIFNTITMRLLINIESQFLLTFYLVILPILLSAVIVRGFNYLLQKWLIRNKRAPKEEDQKEGMGSVAERIRKI